MYVDGISLTLFVGGFAVPRAGGIAHFVVGCARSGERSDDRTAAVECRVVIDDVHTHGASPLAICAPFDLSGCFGALDGACPWDELVGTRVFHALAVKVGKVVIEHLCYVITAVIHADAGENGAIIHGFSPSLHVLGAAVGVRMAQNGVVVVALHGLGKAV